MFKSPKTNLIFLGVIGLMLVGAFYIAHKGAAQTTNTATTTDVTGYAWSDNIGWISFSGDIVPLAIPTCTVSSYNYSAWSPSTCPSNGQQTRTVTNNPNCSGGTSPVLTQSCTYTPTCTALLYNYSAWSPSTCSSSRQQTRTVTNTPNCSGGVSPVLSQSCTYVPPTCTSFTYSYGTCQADGTQTATVTGSSPAGCTGGNPVTSQSCTPICTMVVSDVSCTDPFNSACAKAVIAQCTNNKTLVPSKSYCAGPGNAYPDLSAYRYPSQYSMSCTAFDFEAVQAYACCI